MKIFSFLAPFISKVKTADIFNFPSVKYIGKGLWKLTPKQVFGESFKFLDPPTTKWWSFKFFEKLNGNQVLIANFSKLHKYRTFGLMELHILSKGQLADRILKLWKSCVYDYRVVEHTFFFNSAFCFLNFAKWGKYESLNFAGISKMYCCWLF